MNIKRVGVFVSGLLLIAAGIVMEVSQNNRLSKAPNAAAVLIRPAAAGSTDWTVVPAGEARKPGDAEVSFTFQVSQSARVRKSIVPRSWSVLAGMSVDPPEIKGPDGQAVSLETSLREHRINSMLAGEVEARTGIAEFAKAVRNLGTAVEIEQSTKWLAWGLIIGGIILAVLAGKWGSW